MLKLFSIEKNILAIFLLSAFLGLAFPEYFSWSNNLLYPLLTVIAFCIGLTLQPENFMRAWKNKNIIFPVLLFKFSIIPLMTFLICTILNVPTVYTIGLVTLTCCPAANTGNIMCYLSRGNTAMIVISTITGALLSPLITPAIIYLLLHKIVKIQFGEVFHIITLGITIPILVGIFTRYLLSKYVLSISRQIPKVGIIAVSIIIASIFGKHSDQIYNLSLYLPFLCFFLITLFLILGFLFSKFIKCGIENSIAMSFEVGTFDGVLGILLTLQIIGNAGTLPVVLFAVLNLIAGSIATKVFTSNSFLRIANAK